MSNGKGDTPRPLSVTFGTFAERWEQTFSARRELTEMLRADFCPECRGEGRDPDHFKDACSECGGSGQRKKAA